MHHQHAGLSQVLAEQHRSNGASGHPGAADPWRSPAPPAAPVAGGRWLAAGPVASRGRAGRQTREPQGAGQPGGLPERIATSSYGAATPTRQSTNKIAYVRTAT
jgi:hypothetical protein